MVCLPPCGGRCRDHAQDPAFVPGTSEVAIEFWPSVSCSCVQLFLIPYSFFVFCLREVRRRHLSRCKHCSKESQVPACVTVTQSSFISWITSDGDQDKLSPNVAPWLSEVFI